MPGLAVAAEETELMLSAVSGRSNNFGGLDPFVFNEGGNWALGGGGVSDSRGFGGNERPSRAALRASRFARLSARSWDFCSKSWEAGGPVDRMERDKADRSVGERIGCSVGEDGGGGLDAVIVR